MKNKILELRALGKSYDEISLILGCSKATISYHCSLKVREKSKKARLRNKRKYIIELKRMFGGKCSLCNYDKCLTSLHFHHLDPSKKENKVSILLNGSSKKAAFEEAKKCILVCANCHGEIEEKKRGTHILTVP